LSPCIPIEKINAILPDIKRFLVPLYRRVKQGVLGGLRPFKTPHTPLEDTFLGNYEK